MIGEGGALFGGEFVEHIVESGDGEAAGGGVDGGDVGLVEFFGVAFGDEGAVDFAVEEEVGGGEFLGDFGGVDVGGGEPAVPGVAVVEVDVEAAFEIAFVGFATELAVDAVEVVGDGEVGLFHVQLFPADLIDPEGFGEVVVDVFEGHVEADVAFHADEFEFEFFEGVVVRRDVEGGVELAGFEFGFEAEGEGLMEAGEGDAFGGEDEFAGVNFQFIEGPGGFFGIVFDGFGGGGEGGRGVGGGEGHFGGVGVALDIAGGVLAVVVDIPEEGLADVEGGVEDFDFGDVLVEEAVEGEVDEDGVESGDGAEGAVGGGDGEAGEFDALVVEVFDEAFGFEGGVVGVELDGEGERREAGGDFLQGDLEVFDSDEPGGPFGFFGGRRGLRRGGLRGGGRGGGAGVEDGGEGFTDFDLAAGEGEAFEAALGDEVGEFGFDFEAADAGDGERGGAGAGGEEAGFVDGESVV